MKVVIKFFWRTRSFLFGSGSVTGGEDCDIASSATDNTGKVGCSANCLHLGTELSQNWCDNNKDVSSVSSVCKNAVSVCGNGFIETGEECEIPNLNTDQSVDYKINFTSNYIGSFSTTTGHAHEYCNSRCLLKNLCEVNIKSDMYCEAGTEGCSNDCTLAGSSALYSESSVCGDGVVGIGEFDLCEVTSSTLWLNMVLLSAVLWVNLQSRLPQRLVSLRKLAKSPI